MAINKFKVDMLMEACTIYTAEIEAESAEKAYEIAYDSDMDIWIYNGIREFDISNYEVYDEEGNFIIE